MTRKITFTTNTTTGKYSEDIDFDDGDTDEDISKYFLEWLCEQNNAHWDGGMTTDLKEVDEKVTAFKCWLKDHATRNQEISKSKNKTFKERTFHLGESSAFELALQEFNRIFKEE